MPQTELPIFPVDQAVYQIIKGSHLALTPEMYVHPLRIREAAQQQVFPLVSSITKASAYVPHDQKIYANLTVLLFLKTPEKILRNDNVMDAMMLSAHSAGYTRDLIEISEWIGGIRKLPNKKSLLDVRIARNSAEPIKFKYYYGYSTEDPAEGEARALEKIFGASVYDLFIMQMDMLLYSVKTDLFCCPATFNPDIEPFDLG